MNMKASNEVEPIYDNQPKKIINTKQSLKNEKQFPIIDTKRKREDISRDDQPKKRKRQPIVSNKVKEEPIDIEMQTSSKYQMDSKSEDVEIKEKEKFSAREEFANKISIVSLNEETTSIINQPTTSYDEPNNPTNKKSK